MAAISLIPSSLLCYRTHKETLSTSSSFLSIQLRRIAPLSLSNCNSSQTGPKSQRREITIKAIAEDETLAPVEEAEEMETVSVPVSPSDMLTMFFKAEGTMDESGIANVSNALKEVEGISDLKVQIAEGIASVELTKQTTVQATGVASNLVEVIQGSGMKLQTLNLSFEGDEDAAS